MNRPELTVLFGVLGLLASLLVAYLVYHPILDYQKEQWANMTVAGKRRARIAMVALVVFVTGFSILIGLAFPMSPT